MSTFKRLKQAVQRQFSFLWPRPAKTNLRHPVTVARGQAALTADILRQKDEFEAKLATDPVYRVAKEARDKAIHQKKRHSHHQDAMKKRMNEILAEAKAKRDNEG